MAYEYRDFLILYLISRRLVPSSLWRSCVLAFGAPFVCAFPYPLPSAPFFCLFCQVFSPKKKRTKEQTGVASSVFFLLFVQAKCGLPCFFFLLELLISSAGRGSWKCLVLLVFLGDCLFSFELSFSSLFLILFCSAAVKGQLTQWLVFMAIPFRYGSL